MKTPWFAVVFFSSLLPLSLPASGQNSQGESSNQPTTQSTQDTDAQASLDDCLPRDSQKEVTWDLIYPGTKASYVGGTVPEMHMSEESVFLAPGESRQFRRNGTIALSSGCLLFAFRAKAEDRFERDANYRILGCSNKVELSDKDRTCRVTNVATETNYYVLTVPYAKVNVLSRERYSTSDLTSISTAYATFGGAILTAIASSVHQVAAKERALGITAGALTLYYYLAIARPRMQDKYIAIFIELPVPHIRLSRNESNRVTITTLSPHYFREGQQVQISDVANSDLSEISEIRRDQDGTVTVKVKNADRLPPLGSQVQIVHVTDPSFDGQFQVASSDSSKASFTYEQKGKPEAPPLDRKGKVQDVWNGTFTVESATRTVFTYEQVGPKEDSIERRGTVELAEPVTTNLTISGSLAKQPAAATPKSVDLTGTLTPPPAKSDELFKRGDLVMFRIPNNHDYYNIAMTLSSGTGLTFVSETAEKPAK